jgi:hypothetical protein
MAVGDSWLEVLDVSDPANLVSVGRYGPVERPWVRGIATSGNYDYLAAGYAGVHILRIDAPPEEVRLSAGFAGNELRLKWPGNAADYVLESTPSLSMPQWQVVSNTPQLQDNSYVVSLSVDGAAQFFRLRRP